MNLIKIRGEKTFVVGKNSAGHFLSQVSVFPPDIFVVVIFVGFEGENKKIVLPNIWVRVAVILNRIYYCSGLLAQIHSIPLMEMP